MSIWDYKLKVKKNKSLDKNIEVDNLIIGAGITGITLGYYLNDLPNTIIVDSGKVGYGVTLNSTAKINYLQGSIYKISTITDDLTAKNYLNSQKYAINLIKKIIEEEKIECDLKRVDSYLAASKKSDIKNLKNEVRVLIKNGINIKEKKLNDGINFYKSYYVKDTYVFNPDFCRIKF